MLTDDMLSIADSFVCFGSACMCCYTSEIPLPETARRIWKDSYKTVHEADEEEVWCAVGEMVRLVDERRGEGYAAVHMRFPPEVIDRIALAESRRLQRNS